MSDYDPMDVPAGETQQKLRTISFTALLTWGIIACIVVMLLGPLAGLRLQPTSAYLAAQNTPESGLPAFDPNSSEPLAAFAVTTWLSGDNPIYVDATQLSTQSMQAGIIDGTRAYLITYTEEGFNNYLYYWYTQIIQPQMPELQNPFVDLKRGAMMVSFNIYIGEIQERFGLLYELDDSTSQIKFRGIDRNGQLLAVGEGSFLDNQGLFIEDLANRTVMDTTLWEGTDTQLAIKQISITEDGIQILALAK
jgi:hypothetical protein